MSLRGKVFPRAGAAASPAPHSGGDTPQLPVTAASGGIIHAKGKANGSASGFLRRIPSLDNLSWTALFFQPEGECFHPSFSQISVFDVNQPIVPRFRQIDVQANGVFLFHRLPVALNPNPILGRRVMR